MIGNLSRRERMLIGGAGVIAVIVLGWVVIVQPIRDANRTAAELVPVREQVLMRRQDLVGRKAAIVAELEATNQRLESLSERFLPAGTPAVAASELQKLLKGMAAQASTDVRSERILPPVERGDLLEIPIEIAVSGEIRQLVELLALIDRAPKLLAVQDLKVRVVNITQPKELLATLTLSGFILPGKLRT
jgi:Tfp pilus assembly protein PilO